MARRDDPERFARKFATFLHPSVPAPIGLLCKDLRCTGQALVRAAEALSLLNVRAVLNDDGWRVDPDHWRACQNIGWEYVNAVDAWKASKARL